MYTIPQLNDALRGRYEIDRELGRGGMATVYRARDVRHDRPVAVKVVSPEVAESLGAERFLREVQITARLSHPHILPLLDSGVADGLLFYVMPLVQGESLRDRLTRDGALPIADALRIAREVADALAYAHDQGIVHRDIKPENILLQGMHALVADFGIARALDGATSQRLTATGLAIGTPLYMSPEQAHAEGTIDGRSDQYALGCVTYEMLTGEPPYTGPTPVAITARKLTEPMPPLVSRRPTVPPAVEATLRRALAVTPGDRFRTTLDFAEHLSAFDAPAVPDALRTAPATASASTSRGSARWRSATLALVAVAVAVTVAVGGWLATRDTGASTAADALSTIAVLPFENLSADSAQAYFADGLTDELISSLSLVEGVRVASRTSTFALKEQALRLTEIGERLGVGTVLEGSVRRGEGRIRVSARLVTVADGYPKWSETYERNADDALKIQEEIATAIVETLRGRLGGAQRAVVSSGTTDPEAYDLYLRGRYFRARRTTEGLRRAVDLFQAALARAPDFARAKEGLAESFAVMGFYEVEPPREAFPAARRAAEEALRLDPQLGSAHATLGYVALYHEWDFARAEREFRQAIARAPSYATAHQWYANHLTVMGRFDEAERSMRQALVLDPLAVIANAALVWVFYHKGDQARAIAQYREVLELDSTFALSHLWGGQALEVGGRLDEAVSALRLAARLSGDGGTELAALARALALRGDRAEAEALLERAMRLRVVPAYDIAKAQLALGRREAALAWLERAHQARSHSMVLMRVDPQLAALRGDATFEALVRRSGL